ncbi:peptidyl-prolyl cis-trans isomerase D [Labrys monachus]|uniref:Parvulin-like PPIase n=2 Tax=Labrys monachus TaxID=217067 RepID=A0ABU0FF08_9HYPH|nr:peptidyl-prolyl cis-trans isomerase D [Labrys monachus]
MSKGPAKVVTGVVMALLIGSFALWGIEDVFRGGGSSNVASVGNTEISSEAYMEAYRQRTAAITRQTGKGITPEIARAFGLDKQVLNALLADATLDNRTVKYGLGLDQQKTVQAVVNDPNFQVSRTPGQPPVFDPVAFRQLLQENGLSEQGFFNRQRQVYVRGQLDQAFAEGGPVPVALQQAVARYSQEKRNISYFVLPQSSVGDVGQPDQKALQSYYDENKGSFRTPELRGLTYLLVTPADLAKQANVTDADLKAAYDSRIASYSKPETRAIEQISFPTPAEAKAASDRIGSGQTTFDALVTERKLKPEDVDLGTLAKTQISDPKIADAAFSLKEGATSAPIQGALTNVILKVTKVEPANVAAFDSVKEEIRQALVAERSGEVLRKLRDEIDDERMGGTSLKDIGAKLKLPVASAAGIDRQGRDQAGKPVDVPLQAQVLPALFSTEQGSDPEAIDGREGGLMWFSLDNVVPSRDRSLDEAKSDVIAAWAADQRVQRLKDKADDLVKQMNGGKALEDVAKGLNLQVMPAWNLVRNGENQPVPPATVSVVFATPLKGFASSLAANGTDRIVLHVEDNVIPDVDLKAPETVAQAKHISQGVGEDLMSEYVRKVQADLGTTINQTAVDRVVGGGSGL